MAKVSIVVPVYNAQRRLRACIHSILRQTERNWELILVDDGSIDQSGAICDEYAAKDKRIQVVHQTNQGSIAARKRGVSLCTAPYSCFCDADDIMPANALNILLSAAEVDESERTVVTGMTSRVIGPFVFQRKNKVPCFRINEPKVYNREDFIRELYCSWFGISNFPVSLWAKLYPSSLLKETMERVPKVVDFFGDDLVMTLDLMPLATRTIIVPETVYAYRPGGGTSKFQAKMMDDWIALYHFKADYAKRYPMPQNISKLMDVELCNSEILTLKIGIGTFANSSRDFDHLGVAFRSLENLSCLKHGKYQRGQCADKTDPKTVFHTNLSFVW